MKRIYFLILLVVVFSGCKRSPPPAALASAQSAQVTFAQFEPDGRRIVTASKDGTMRIWDAQTGRELSSTNGALVWELSKSQATPPRYAAGTPDHMPIVGGDSFKVLQDQIDALEKRVRELETNTARRGR